MSVNTQLRPRNNGMMHRRTFRLIRVRYTEFLTNPERSGIFGGGRSCHKVQLFLAALRFRSRGLLDRRGCQDRISFPVATNMSIKLSLGSVHRIIGRSSGSVNLTIEPVTYVHIRLPKSTIPNGIHDATQGIVRLCSY